MIVLTAIFNKLETKRKIFSFKAAELHACVCACVIVDIWYNLSKGLTSVQLQEDSNVTLSST